MHLATASWIVPRCCSNSHSHYFQGSPDRQPGWHPTQSPPSHSWNQIASLLRSWTDCDLSGAWENAAWSGGAASACQCIQILVDYRSFCWSHFALGNWLLSFWLDDRFVWLAAWSTPLWTGSCYCLFGVSPRCPAGPGGTCLSLRPCQMVPGSFWSNLMRADFVWFAGSLLGLLNDGYCCDDSVENG